MNITILVSLSYLSLIDFWKEDLHFVSFKNKYIYKASSSSEFERNREKEREREREKENKYRASIIGTCRLIIRLPKYLDALLVKLLLGNRSPLVKLEEANGDCRPENTIFRQSGFLEDGRQSSTT